MLLLWPEQILHGQSEPKTDTFEINFLLMHITKVIKITS